MTSTKAVLLAAGAGMRLRPYTETHPKCLVEIGGRSLLARHLDILSNLQGIDALVLVVGYRAEQIQAAVAGWQRETGSDFPVHVVMNEQYRKGSILSLYSAREAVAGCDAVIMDADVLYPAEMMARLVASRHPNCFLLDEAARESGEEMMVCVRQGRVLNIARSRDPVTHLGWDLKGEGVGFFRLGAGFAPVLWDAMATLLGQGQDGAEYEVALAQFMGRVPCGYETVGDLPWTEIDFEEDIARAEGQVLPAIEEAGGRRARNA